MCGYWYSNKKHFTSDTVEIIKRRGPELYKEISNDCGFFGHALLTTIGNIVPQPIENQHGILLYNGSTYNSQPDNDTLWIVGQLDNSLDNTLEVIRALNGEYSLLYATEAHIVFCTDQWSTRNLWFYYSQEQQQLAVSSLKKVLLDNDMPAWPAEENKIYILDRKTFEIFVEDNTCWNLTQHINHYDFVFENFEQAVVNRHEKNLTTYLISSGYDSGVIACAAQKHFDKINTVTAIQKEDKKILAERLKYHRGKIEKVNYDEQQQDYDNLHSLMPHRFMKSNSTKALTSIIKNHMLPDKHKILITGMGGDEIYVDYSHEHRSQLFRKLGGHFPDNLELVYPWHNFNDFNLLKQNLRVDLVCGYFGTESRLPLLDQKLFQSWLNITAKLKNSEYKGWMKQYMLQENYPISNVKYGWGQLDEDDSEKFL